MSFWEATVYAITDHPDAEVPCPVAPPARDVLARILATDGAPASATAQLLRRLGHHSVDRPLRRQPVGPVPSARPPAPIPAWQPPPPSRPDPPGRW